jgi:polyisoprenyl-teichoic acid--peptidoglycan teichoic acid transferase
MSRVSARPSRSRPVFDRITLIVLVVFLIVAAITAVLTFQWVRGFVASWTISDLPGMPVVSDASAQGLPTPPVNGLSENVKPPSGSLDPQLGPTPIPWDGSSRVTILVMGLDYRDWSEGVDVPRTDTMILFTIDPLTKSAGMLSIPRDLWVTIPGMENNRINTAYRWGEIYKLPDGPSLAMKTVEGVIGVPIQYYALLDFNSVVKFIDEMGGLDMHIKEAITVDPIGPGNTVRLEPGVQPLDGATVLAYARQRKDGDGDFSRSARQQEVIMAMRDQVLTLNMMPTLVKKAPALYQEISEGIRTNLTLDQVIKLSWLALQIKEENIKKGVFDPHRDVQYASVDSSEGRQDVLIPNPDQIRLLRDEIFATGGPVGPVAVAGDPALLMTTEAARVLLRNGTSTVGLAGKTGELLRAQNLNITGEENADSVYGQTIIIDYTGKPYTINFLIQQLNIKDSVQVRNRFDPNAQVDVEVILGQDWANQLP